MTEEDLLVAVQKVSREKAALKAAQISDELKARMMKVLDERLAKLEAHPAATPATKAAK